jgi:hypothetical protein
LYLAASSTDSAPLSIKVNIKEALKSSLLALTLLKSNEEDRKPPFYWLKWVVGDERLELSRFITNRS